MRNSQRPQGREAAACQDILKAFLAERRMGGMFFHIQLAKHLAKAGFEVRHVERKDYHDVWVFKLRRGQVSAGREIEWTQNQVQRFLKRYGLRYPRKEIVVMARGDRIEAAFNWSRGKAGWVSYGRQKAGRRSNGKG